MWIGSEALIKSQANPFLCPSITEQMLPSKEYRSDQSLGYLQDYKDSS